MGTTSSINIPTYFADRIDNLLGAAFAPDVFLVVIVFLPNEGLAVYVCCAYRRVDGYRF